MIIKCCKDRKKINSFNREEKNYKKDTKDDINLDQAKNKYLLQLKVAIGGNYRQLKKEA